MIRYRSLRRWKYQLAESYSVVTDIKALEDIVDHEFICLSAEDKVSARGTLILKKGYAWDGATCAIDTKTIMRASLVHDAFTQLIAEKRLPFPFRKRADKILYDMCIEDGMSRIRAFFVFHAVRVFVKIRY